MAPFTTRYFLSLGNVAFSLVLGVVLFAATWLFYPTLTLSMLKGAEALRQWLVATTGNPQHEIIARTVLHESSIVLMGFTLMARILVGGLIVLVRKLAGG